MRSVRFTKDATTAYGSLGGGTIAKSLVRTHAHQNTAGAKLLLPLLLTRHGRA
ncbi:MAG TPA: hypothetical protein VE690_07605 [Rhodopila sp.]|nr:hypothetical protein [Rhodopila sp.]